MPKKQRPLVCYYCPTRFKYQSVLEEHVQRVHTDSAYQSSYCTTAEDVTINQLVDYLKSDHSSWAAYAQSN